MKNDPELLERRFRFKEKEEKQKIIVPLIRLTFILCFLIPGFNYRFGWSEVALTLVLFANIIVFLGYLLVFLVFRENSHTSHIVEVKEGQKIISTGPYSIILHPMYLVMSIMYLFTPLAPDSWWSLFVFLFVPVVLVFRIFNEESILLK